MTHTSTPEWLSAYLFFHGDIYSPVADQLVAQLVTPFVAHCQENNLIDQYFFIRYSENGPHIRLRLFGTPTVLENTVKPALQEQLLPDMDLRWIPYEPEIARYGGPAGIAIAEDFFHQSSQTSLQLISQFLGKGQGARLGKGLLAMVVLIHAFYNERAEAAHFFHNYSTGYLKSRVRNPELQTHWRNKFQQGFDKQSAMLAAYVNETWKRLDANAPVTPVLDAYYRQMETSKTRFASAFEAGDLRQQDDTPFTDWHNATRAIISSYVHMMNNRLGINIEDETYLAYLITQALSPPKPEPVTEQSLATPA